MMGFEDEMYEWEEERKEGKPIYQDSDVYIKLHDTNKINCQNAPMMRIIWEYICWVLAGRPDHTYHSSRK